MLITLCLSIWNIDYTSVWAQMYRVISQKITASYFNDISTLDILSLLTGIELAKKGYTEDVWEMYQLIENDIV